MCFLSCSLTTKYRSDNYHVNFKYICASEIIINWRVRKAKEREGTCAQSSSILLRHPYIYTMNDVVTSFQFLCNVIVYFLVMHAQILSMVWIKKCNNTPIIDKLAPSFPPHHLVDALIDRKVYQTEDLPSCTMYACKCMYVCMYGCVCMYVCVYVSMYVCMHACMHALCMYVRTYVSILPSPIQFFEFCAIVYLLVIVHCH